MSEYTVLTKLSAVLAAASLILIAFFSCLTIGVSCSDPERFHIVDLSEGWTDTAGAPFALDSFTKQADDTAQYIYRTITSNDNNIALIFRSRNMFVNVYADGQLVSRDVSGQSTLFGSSPGSRWHIIALGSTGQYTTICIESVSCYDNASCTIDSIYVGQTADLYRRVATEHLGAFLIAVCLQLAGVIMLILYVLLRKKLKLSKDMLYVGSAIFFAAQWISSESTLWQLFFDHSEAIHLIGYFSLTVLPIPFGMLAAERIDHKGWHLTARIFTIIACVNALVCTVLHITGIWEFHYSQRITHTLIVLMLPLLVLLILSYNDTSKSIVKNTIIYVALITLVLCTLTAIIQYALGQYGTYSLYVRVALVAFLFCLIIYQFNQMADLFAKGLRADMMHRLALTDYLTGLFNRTAFAEHKPSYVTMTEFRVPLGIAQFDVNNLKKVNDNLGHEKGDQLLKCAAEGFRQCFEEHGSIYRMGGDEFLVILDGETPQEDYDAAITRLDAYCDEINSRPDLDFRLVIAHGFILNEGADLDASIEEADARMYENKKLLKHRY